MRIAVLGADGYIGWPLCVHLAKAGHQVIAADNYFKRTLARSIDVEPLFDVPLLTRRVAQYNMEYVWKVEKEMAIALIDATDFNALYALCASYRPEVIVHLAEQPSGPYSMISNRDAWVTLENNLQSTLNVAHVAHAFGITIVKLGTMGEYGTPPVDIPEGWITFTEKEICYGKPDKTLEGGPGYTALFPREAGSLYHTSKILDTDLLWFYTRLWKLRVTDLMQGPVFGLSTDAEHEERFGPITHLWYDGVFGTVLNRFCVQAVFGHPLTVYGEGNQTRGYINLVDSVNAIRLACEKPPSAGELRIINQITETATVNQLADRVVEAAKSIALKVYIENIENPRVENENNYYSPTYTALRDLGLKAHQIDAGVILKMLQTVERYKDRIRKDLFLNSPKWRQHR